MQEDIRSLSLPELETVLAALGERPYRARQLYTWFHQKLAFSYEEMTDLPKALRLRLNQEAPLYPPLLETLQVSQKDGTRKYLYRLRDGAMVECVLMHYHHGNSVCISSQVGCAMGCRFCASTIGGKERNLLPSEMLDQIYAIQKDTGERVSHVVVMGSGEPLDNLDNLLAFLGLLTSQEGLKISQRNVTVSTCGLVPQIYALAKEKLAITLAISLHAPNDEIRQSLMPVARRYPMQDLLSAVDCYQKETGRRVTFEYALIRDLNDAPDQAQALAGQIRFLHPHVNLIPVNPVQERSFRRGGRTQIESFKNKLENCGINVTIRREMGSDIDGACGQLRSKYRKKESNPVCECEA